MAQQTLRHEKIPGIHHPETQLISAVEHIGNSLRRHAPCCLLTVLFCLTFSLTTLAQGPATEVRIQVIPSASTVKCNQDDYNLFVVRATMPASPTEQASLSASALGIALAHTGKGAVKMFARYWFSFTDQPLLKRDDDVGKLGTNLRDFDESSFKGNVNRFFQGCTADKEASVVFQVLDKANSKSSVDEIVNAFRANGLELQAEAATSGQQNLNKPPTNTDEGQVLFAGVIRTSLVEQLEKKASTAEAAASPLPVSDPSAGDASAASTELKAIKKSLEDAGKKFNSLSTLLSILLGVLATALLLGIIFIVLFYFSPTLQRKVFFHSEDATEIRRQAIDELYAGLRKIGEPTEAQQRLDDILKSHGQRFDEAGDKPAAIKSTYRDLETALKNFSLSLAVDKNRDVDRNEDGAITTVRQFLSDHFGVEFANKDLVKALNDLTDELNENLLPLAGRDSNSHSRTRHQLKATRQHIEAMWSKYSSEQCPKGALAILEREWEICQKTLQPLKQIGPQSALAYAQESVALFNFLHEKFRHQLQKPEDLKPAVERFFKVLDKIQVTHLPAHTQRNPTPANILADLSEVLNDNKRTADKLSRLNIAISNFQRPHPSDGGANTDSIDLAIKMVKHYKTALELLKDYRPTDDRNNIAQTVQAFQNRIQSATTAILEVMPTVSGTIDVMVSSLVNEFKSKVELAKKAEELSAEAERLQSELRTSQAQAEDSTKLAGALSQYVNLSPDKKIDPSQVQCILQRFSAGESVHRQLRLRLSAAIPALDQAIEDVGNAGREDALDALRISDFKDRLRGLLTNIEDFTGDAMWKDCLSSGFSQQWLHNLLRAELLARTYFAEDESLSLLVDPLTEASGALRATIRHLNVRVPVLSLLSKPPDGARVDYEVDPRLSRLQEVRRKVRAVWAQRNPGDKPNFIVDVELFPLQSESTEDFGGRVVGVTPAEWD